MAKIETPQTVQPEKSLDELSKEEVSQKLASFKEILDKHKDIDVYELLGLEKPSKNSEVDPKLAEDLTNKYNDIVSQMREAGVPIPKEAKMSEAERAINERLEKQAKAKFMEQKTEVLKIDKDFPVDVIEKADTSIDDKVTLMAIAREVASRNAEAISKLQKELDTVSAELKDAKLRAPEEEKKEKTGEEILKSKMKQFGLELPEEESE